MSILDRFTVDEEDILKSIHPEHLEKLNDDDLVAEFMFRSGQFRRLKADGEKLVQEMRDRGMEMPASGALFGVVKGENVEKDENEAPNEPSGLTTFVEDDFESRVVVKSEGPTKAKVAFVGASPSKLDMIRRQPFTGPIGRTLKDVYFKAAGVSEGEVLLTHLVPVYLSDDNGPREPTNAEIEKYSEWFSAQMEQYQPQYVVALGKTAAEHIEADEWVPHPRAVNIHGDSGEVGRKLSRLSDKIAKNAVDVGETAEKRAQILVEKSGKWLVKADDEQQVVIGVVMEPDELDTDENWTNAEEIEKAAHRFMLESQTIGLEHVFKVEDAAPVESFIAPTDFEIDGETVKKGSWIMGVKVFSDEIWNLVKSGELTGFSIGAAAEIDPNKKLN